MAGLTKYSNVRRDVRVLIILHEHLQSVMSFVTCAVGEELRFIPLLPKATPPPSLLSIVSLIFFFSCLLAPSHQVHQASVAGTRVCFDWSK
jgi:hypothetical protein